MTFVMPENTDIRNQRQQWENAEQELLYNMYPVYPLLLLPSTIREVDNY